MMSNDQWEKVWLHLETVFKQLATEVKECIPSLSWECGHNANAVFPFRAYATFRSQSKVVDLSVDCKLSEEVMLISTDLAREGGLVLSELPTQIVSVKLSQPEMFAEIESAIANVEGFVLNQRDPINEQLGMN